MVTPPAALISRVPIAPSEAVPDSTMATAVRPADARATRRTRQPAWTVTGPWGGHRHAARRRRSTSARSAGTRTRGYARRAVRWSPGRRAVRFATRATPRGRSRASAPGAARRRLRRRCSRRGRAAPRRMPPGLQPMRRRPRLASAPHRRPEVPRSRRVPQDVKGCGAQASAAPVPHEGPCDRAGAALDGHRVRLSLAFSGALAESGPGGALCGRACRAPGAARRRIGGLGAGGWRVCREQQRSKVLRLAMGVSRPVGKSLRHVLQPARSGTPRHALLELGMLSSTRTAVQSDSRPRRAAGPPRCRVLTGDPRGTGTQPRAASCTSHRAPPQSGHESGDGPSNRFSIVSMLVSSDGSCGSSSRGRRIRSCPFTSSRLNVSITAAMSAAGST